MRSLLSATALSALLALAAPAFAQSAGTLGGGSMGGTQMQGQTPGSPPPMAQPAPATMGAASGSHAGPQAMTMDESQVRDLLRNQGYGEAESVMRNGDSFSARVTRNGRPADVTIDAYTGTISNQAARR